MEGVRVSHVGGGVQQGGSDPVNTGQDWEYAVLGNPRKWSQRPLEAFDLDYSHTLYHEFKQ